MKSIKSLAKLAQKRVQVFSQVRLNYIDYKEQFRMVLGLTHIGVILLDKRKALKKKKWRVVFLQLIKANQPQFLALVTSLEAYSKMK